VSSYGLFIGPLRDTASSNNRAQISNECLSFVALARFRGDLVEDFLNSRRLIIIESFLHLLPCGWKQFRTCVQ